MSKVKVGYNVQIAVDAKHHLIVEPEVVQSACDRGNLSSMAIASQEALEVQTLKVVADAGYHDVDQLETCESKNIETYVPDTGKSSGKTPSGKEVFPKDQFFYNAEADHYRCPAGQLLSRRSITKLKGKDRITYNNPAACRKCLFRKHCTTAAVRAIYRRPNEAVAERQSARMVAHPEMMKKRKSIVEHVFGTMRIWDQNHFLTRGLERVRAEFSLSALAYNIRRLLNLRNVAQLLSQICPNITATA